MLCNRSKRCGYVLVLTLGLLTLTAISLASLARFRIQSDVSAAAEAEELQRRWGLLSVRHFFTEQAATILDVNVHSDELNSPQWPKPASGTFSFPLGNQVFSVSVSDEDAKVDLNTVYVRAPERLLTTIRNLNSGRSALIVRPMPQTSEGRPFASWGQVFDLANLPPERQAATELLQSTSQITCWGSRRLNLRRASDRAVREVARLTLPAKEVGELIELRKQWSGGDVKDLIEQLDVRRPQVLAANRLFSNESRSYSVWIEIDNGQRKWSYQFVDDNGPVCFSW
jgi:hypothetical protein